MSDTAVRKVWRWEDQCGAEAPTDVDRRLVVAAWLNDVEGLTLDELTEAEIARLAGRMRHCWLYSVVKADLDCIDADLGEFHSDGSGKRSMSAWFIDVQDIYAAADAVIARAGV